MGEVKSSNPKDALGIRKVPMHTVPVKPLLELGLAMMEGGRKYGAHNYRSIGVRASVYYDAAMRHLMAWWEGEDYDPDSGVHHIIKAMACLSVLRDSQHMGNSIDDRPIKYPDGINMIAFNDVAADVLEKYPDCVEPFTAVPCQHPTPEEPTSPFPVKLMAIKDWESLRTGDKLIISPSTSGNTSEFTENVRLNYPVLFDRYATDRQAACWVLCGNEPALLFRGEVLGVEEKHV